MATKSKNLKILEDLFHDQKVKGAGAMPVSYIPRTKFSEKDANSLTASIIAWIEVHGGMAERVSSTGLYRNGRWTKSNGRLGTADISAIAPGGLSLRIEVKYGKDRMSDDQIKYKSDVERAGGIYLIARTFDQIVSDLKPYLNGKD
jgi:hypothetical protein